MNKDFNPDWLNELIKRLAEHKDVKFVTRSSGGDDFIIVRTHSNFDIIGLITEPDKRIDRALIQCNNITSPLTQATTRQLVNGKTKKGSQEAEDCRQVVSVMILKRLTQCKYAITK